MSLFTDAFTSAGSHPSVTNFEVSNGPPSLQTEIAELKKLVHEQALTILQLQLTLRDREEKLRHDLEKLFEERFAHLFLQFTSQQQDLSTACEDSIDRASQTSHKNLLSVANKVKELEDRLNDPEERLAVNNSIRMTRPPLTRKDSFGEEHKGPPNFDSPLLLKRSGISLTKFPEDNVYQTQPPRVPPNSNLNRQPVVSFSQSGIDPTPQRSLKVSNSKSLATPKIHTRSISPSWHSDYVTPRNHSPANSLPDESDTLS